MEDYEVNYYTVLWRDTSNGKYELKHKSFDNEDKALQCYKELLSDENACGLSFQKVLHRIWFPWDED